MAFGKTARSDGMNQHKMMSGAGRKDDFDVSAYPGRQASHPDMTMDHKTMDDGERGAKPPMKNGARLMQSAPDHGIGKGAPDHFKRGGQV